MTRFQAQMAASLLPAGAAVAVWLALAGVLVPAMALVLAATALATVLTLPVGLALSLPLLLVGVFGEGFRIPLIGLAVVHVGTLAAVSAVLRSGPPTLPARTKPLDAAIAALALVALGWTVLGVVAGGPGASPREDVVPLAFLLVSYSAVRMAGRGSRAEALFEACCYAGAALAFLKLVYILVSFDYLNQWNGAWQAIRSSGPLPRIILRGADALFPVVVVLFLATRRQEGGGRPWKVAIACMAFTAVLISGSRGNWLGLAVGSTVAMMTSASRRRFRLPAPKPLAVSSLILALAAFVMLAPTLAGLASRLTSQALQRQSSVGFRTHESAAAAERSATGLFAGIGFGASFDFFHSDFNREVSSVYSHNVFLHLLLKAGLAGLVTFVAILLLAVQQANAVRAGPAPYQDRWRTWGFACGILAIAVTSVSSNRLTTMSGAIVLGTLLAFIQNAAARAAVPLLGMPDDSSCSPSNGAGRGDGSGSDPAPRG